VLAARAAVTPPHAPATVQARPLSAGALMHPCREPRLALEWFFASCGVREDAEPPYELGDSEPCIYCDDGVARVREARQCR
jgi:hypothetical protein